MNPNKYKEMAQKLKADADTKAKQRAKALFGDPPPGYQDLSKTALIEMAKRHLGDPAYFQGMLTRVGPVNYRNLIIELFGGNEAIWPMPAGDPQHG